MSEGGGSVKRRRLDRKSQPDSLHLAQRNLVLCPIVEFGCPRRLMPGYLLGVLEPSVVFQVNRDAGCSPSVTSYGGQKTRRLSPLPNCSPGINALEQRLPALEACGGDILVQSLLEQVMHWHFVAMISRKLCRKRAQGGWRC